VILRTRADATLSNLSLAL
jgi:hypothetical protein